MLAIESLCSSLATSVANYSHNQTIGGYFMARRSAIKSNNDSFKVFLDSIQDAPEVIISVNDIQVDDSFNVSDIEVGQRIQLVVLHITALLAAIYAAGYVFGEYVHRVNDNLSTWLLQHTTQPKEVTLDTTY
jgi:hypothetical protein